MAHVSHGPVSSLPGRTFAPDAGMTCDTEGHEDLPAVKRVQGETDSFGCEYIDMCQECYDKHLAYVPEDQTCDRCHTFGQCSPRRDPDEGMSGPVYYLCQACRRRDAQRDQEEYESYESAFVDYIDDDSEYDADDSDDN